MCKELPDHEIHADEIEDAAQDLFILEPTDEELEEMNRVWQEAMRGCYQ